VTHNEIGSANSRAILAARNNADWYCMMFDIHGLRYNRSEIAFLATDPPPRYHSWMTTVDSAAQGDLLQLIEQNAYRPSFVVKDSFHCLDLSSVDFVELFSAEWIFAETIQVVDTTGWIQISSINELLLWEKAWKLSSPSDQRQFPNAILNRSDVVIWGRSESNGFNAGVVANVSKDCVGLSNCFGHEAFPAAATLCEKLSHGELPIVGYERGDDLSAALGIGFSSSGKLRVWGRP